MAVFGKDNIVEVVRMQKSPYWRVMETVNSRQAGNYIATADFANPELGLEDSLGKLRDVLNKLTPGRYLLTSFYKSDAKKSGVDTWIEIESGNTRDASISGTGSDFYLEGIGKVTPENFESAIEQKFKKLKEEENEKLRIKNIEEENRRLKLEMREYDSSMNRGIMSIGAVVWNVMRTTEAGKEVIGMMGEFKKFNQPKPNPEPQAADAPRSAYDEAEIVNDTSISGSANGNAEEQMQAALETLAKDNPELIAQLQMMARLKTENPELFNDAVDNLKTIAG